MILREAMKGKEIGNKGERAERNAPFKIVERK